jgi:alpha-galactosidase
MGINPFDFNWRLETGEEFQTPEVVMVYSGSGLGEMSRTYHRLYRNRLARGKFRNALRPIVINNWEATYFDFNEDKLKAIAKEASKLGIEMFVLDDGWFGKRNSDNCSLGDWFVDKEKLPGGLKSLVDAVKDYGMGFGLWFEPEMISPDSELYRAHPDWCLHVPDRHRSLGRNQLILDFSRKDVQDAVIEMISGVLSSAGITYVKWDMNRNMSEIGSDLLPAGRQMETAHRYMLGLYRVMDTITGSFPDILFESCSGGGGRFDPGILYYMPQNWTSDDTDGVERLKIQYGTSMVYPSSAMTAHVSAVPNHQTGRNTSLEFRGNVAMAGNFGYELDVTKMTEEEKQSVKEQVGVYKEIRELVQYGDFYRLLSPFDSNVTAWMYVSEDKKEAAVFCYKVLTTPNGALFRFRLAGLKEEALYSVNGSETVISGAQLMNYGLNMPQELGWGDFTSRLFRLKAESNF